jgi:hypothetical protein
MGLVLAPAIILRAEAIMATTSDDFGEVHTRVLGQHAEIRARLRGLDACAVPAPASIASVHLRISLLRLAALFEAHLVFEELELAPRIMELDAWGPAREAALLADHEEQRTRLRRICAMAEEPSTDDLAFAREVSRFVVSVLEEMAREERELSMLGWLIDYGPEQMTG